MLARIWPHSACSRRSLDSLGSVPDLDFDDRFARLVANVAAARDLLEGAGEEHWARWAGETHRALVAHQTNGLARLLQAYGGMGSFNDVLIHPMNGHRVVQGDCDRTNRELEHLRSAMYDDATAMLREIERAD